MTTSFSSSIARAVAGTAVLLLIPLLGNWFVEGWEWSLSDFVVMGAMLVIVGTALDAVLRSGGKYRIVAAITIAVLFVWLWAELAVGVFTNWGS